MSLFKSGSPIIAAIAASGMTLMASCGFQLRGDPEVGIRKLFISSVGASPVLGDIRRTLATGPTRMVATPVEAEAHLRILQEEREKTVATITGTGRVYEYLLTLRVRYELLVPGREEPVIAPTRLEARRLISYSETAPTAKEAEEQLLFKDMQLDLAYQILRQVAAAKQQLR
jgi:LPS-assembly lipoprotein